MKADRQAVALRAPGAGLLSGRLMAIRPLLALWLAYFALCLAAWWRWGGTGWPMGSFWWDELALSSAAHAVNQGLVPARDFWAPFILPLYIKAWAHQMAGDAAGYLVECLAQGGLVLGLYTLLVMRRPVPWAMHAIAGWAALLALLPFNIESVVEAKTGFVVHAGVYNRLGGSLIMLAVLWLEAERQQRGGLGRMAWLAVLMGVCMLVKVTAWQVVVASLWVHALVHADKQALRTLMQATLLSLTTLTIWLALAGQLPGFLGALLDMARVRSELMQARMYTSLDVLADQRLVLFLSVLVLALVATRGLLLRRSWWPGVAWGLVTLCLVTFYMLSNFGDNGLAPMVAVVWVLLAAVERSAPLAVSARVEAMARMVLLSAWGLWLCHWALYLAFQGHRLHAMLWHASTVVSAQIPVANHHLHEMVRTDAGTWASRLPVHVGGVSLRLMEPAVHAGYASEVDEAAGYLRAHYTSRAVSVYVLDYPALMFSLLEGYRVPHGVWPWMIFGHELSISHHPRADVLLRDVDVLMTSKCSLSSGNRKYLHRIYRAEIEARWQVKAELTCWVVHERKSAP